MNSFMRQFKSARKNIKETAKIMPEIYPQWQEWQSAEQALSDALRRRDEAKARWEKFIK